MRRNKLIILFVLIILFILISLPLIEAREDEIVSVKTFISQDGVHPGGSFKVAFLLNIIPGWHINASGVTDEFLIPSELIIEENDDIKVLRLFYPEPESEKFSYSDIELPVYAGEVILGALIKVSDDIVRRKHILKAGFLYQPCNDRLCMPPKTLNLEIPFNVVSLSRKTKEINKKIFLKIDLEKET